jgi:hypothetical protein
MSALSPRKANGSWTLEACRADARRFAQRAEWRRASSGAYQKAQAMGWLDECCAHMRAFVPSPTKWTLDACRLDALRFSSRVEWMRGSSSGYSTAHRRGWLDECCAHMVGRVPFAETWSLEKCQADAARFDSRRAWRIGSPAAYGLAYRSGWLDLCLPRAIRQWSRADCMIEAAKHATRTEWAKSSPASYNAACRNGWLDATGLPERVRNDAIIWTKAACAREAATYRTRSLWRAGSGGSFDAACRNGWLDELFPARARARFGDDDAARRANRQRWAREMAAARRRATPHWVDRRALAEVYLTCPEGWHVDHVVPILGRTPEGWQVCGLHVPWNLRHLPAAHNQRRGNRMTADDMPLAA